MESRQSDIPVDEQDVEGLDTQDGSWGDYPIDELLIRHQSRTIFDVIRRIDNGRFVMDPDFQRDFIWEADKQSKLIESVLMRIPLPVFYLAEDDEGRMIVVDGLQLKPQQMRNSLFMGPATRFLKEEAKTEIFLKATGRGLNWKIMRDREFVNRFCAFQLLGLDEYRGDMDVYLAECLRRMNKMEDAGLAQLSEELRRSLANNFKLFKRHAFRKHTSERQRRSVLNASLWDVMSTGLSCYPETRVTACAERLRDTLRDLFYDDRFYEAITFGTNDTKRVKTRFKMTREIFENILGPQTTGFATIHSHVDQMPAQAHSSC